MMMLLVHLLLGYRRLREAEHYRDDARVKRVLGLKRLPNICDDFSRLGQQRRGVCAQDPRIVS